MAHSQKPCILMLDAWVKPPEFAFDADIFITPNGQKPDPEALARATIFTTSGTPVNEELIAGAPNLRLVACNGVGTDHVVREPLKSRGISLCHVPAQNTDSVGEHAFALYYALRRRLIPMHQLVMESKLWPEKRSPYQDFGPPTRTNQEETLIRTDTLHCIVGYGALGKSIEKIGNALGMQVIIAERKGAANIRPDRVDFEQALKQSTIFIIVAPLDDSTKGMIGTAELSIMNETALLINVGRGGIVDEAALVDALRDKKIAGAGIDVFETEPATKDNSPLLDPSIPNLILSPHLAWYSTLTIKGTVAMIKANLDAFVAGRPQNLITL